MGHSECRDPPCFSMRSRIELLPFLSLDKAYEIKKMMLSLTKKKNFNKMETEIRHQK